LKYTHPTVMFKQRKSRSNPLLEPTSIKQ